jgi:hypothetical protein
VLVVVVVARSSVEVLMGRLLVVGAKVDGGVTVVVVVAGKVVGGASVVVVAGTLVVLTLATDVDVVEDGATTSTS